MQIEFGQVAALRRKAAEQGGQAPDGSFEIGHDDADMIDARQGHAGLPRNRYVASKSTSSVVGSITTK